MVFSGIGTMSNLSVDIDEISFLVGGYGALGVALCSGNIYRNVPFHLFGHPNSVSDEISWTNEAKSLSLKLARFSMIQLKVVERFFVGGCLYSVINSYLKSRISLPFFNALIAGGLVGASEIGLHERWKKLLDYGGSVAGFACGMETLIFILQKNGVINNRPMYKFMFGDLDPLLFIIGASSSYLIGLYTYALLDDINVPNIPDNMQTDYRELFGFLGKCILNGISLEIKAEECTFFGGCLAWGVQLLLRKIGIRDRIFTASSVGLVVGGYWSLFARVSRKEALLCTGGTFLLSLVAELFVTPNISRDHLWNMIMQGKDDGKEQAAIQHYKSGIRLSVA